MQLYNINIHFDCHLTFTEDFKTKEEKEGIIAKYEGNMMKQTYRKTFKYKTNKANKKHTKEDT